jgi:hypothetical protein
MTIENTGRVHIVDALTFDANALFHGTFALGNAPNKCVNISASPFIVDWLYFRAATANSGIAKQTIPNGTANSSISMLLNSSTGAWGFLETYVIGTTAAINVAGYNGGSGPTVLNIGETVGWLGAWTTGALTTIDFYFNNAIEMQLQPDKLIFNNGTTDTQLDWGTNGELGLQVAAADILRLTASQVQCNQDLVMADAQNIILNTSTGTKIGTSTSQKLGFFNATPVVQPTALTAALTQITHTGPTTPDYNIATPIDSGVGSAWGFSTQDEFETVMSVILNLQTRVDELESKLQSLGLLA